MSDKYINDEPSLIAKLHFEASTVETIDRAMLNYVKSLNLYVDTTTGWRKDPVVWGSAEISFQSNNNKNIIRRLYEI